MSALPKLGDLFVRVTAVGHASARWRGAKNRTEADRNNQALSESRARNVQNFMEAILKQELPHDIHVGVAPKGVGRLQPLWPETPRDDFGINRSVVVTIDLTKIRQDPVLIPGKKKINARTKHWSLRVLSFARLGFGVNAAVATIVLQNQISGKEMKGTAEIIGGGRPDITSKGNPADQQKPIGKEVHFTTREAMGFDDFDGATISMAKVKLQILYGNEMTYIKFPLLHHDPDLLVFDYDQGWGLSADAFYMSGDLSMQGTNPGDYYEVATVDDVIQVPSIRNSEDGMILSFPTGKAELHSLTAADRKRLEDFTRQKARNIAALADSYAVSAAHL